MNSAILSDWKRTEGSPPDVVDNLLDCDIVVSEFDLQSFYYAQFQTNTFGKGMKPVFMQIVLNSATQLGHWPKG